MKVTTNSFYKQNQDATANESYNEQFLSTKSERYSEWKPQRTVFINKIRTLQRMKATTNGFYQQNQDATTNESYNEQFL